MTVQANPIGLNPLNFLYKPGLPGGQTAIGGTGNGDRLILQGSAFVGDVGSIQANSPIQLDYDTFSDATQFALVHDPTANISAGYIGGALQVAATHNVTTGTYIPAVFSDTMQINVGANPGFAAHTFINELATIRNDGNFNLPQSFTINVGTVHERNTSGTSTTPNMRGLSFVPQTRATVSGAVMTKTTQQAVTLGPTFSTVAGSTVNLGTVVGLDCFEPTVATFQPSAGTENMTAYYGLNFRDMTFGGASATYSVIESALNSGTNKRFLNHTGTAISTMLGQLRFEADLTGISFGASNDFSMGWGAGNFLFLNFVSNADQVRISNPASDRFLFDSDTGTSEFNFNCDRFSLGAQTGAVGNQVGAFVAGTRTVTVGGEWSDFLLTQAGNITVDAAMGLVAGWTVNAPSITLGTGSVTTGAALNIGGNPSQGTNRVGLRIISNPSGGGGVNAALWITAGLSRFDGRVDINNGIALGGGAAATLGTIGGSGPTAAAQAQWVEIDIGGTAHWIPAWT